MTTANNTAKKYWMYTWISLAVCLLLLVLYPEFFWVALPFVLTFGVMAYGAI